MKRKDAAHAAKILQAFADGRIILERRLADEDAAGYDWTTIDESTVLMFDIDKYEYRIKPREFYAAFQDDGLVLTCANELDADGLLSGYTAVRCQEIIE